MTDEGAQGQLLPSDGRDNGTSGSVNKEVAAGAAAVTADSEMAAVIAEAGESIVDGNISAGDSNELTGETLIPFTGMVRLSERELEIVDHPAFQRLFEIFQLGQAHLVYRGATHMRGEHAIGCVQAVAIMAEATKRNAASKAVLPQENWQPGERLSEEEVTFARLGALLHDIGHLPAGHTLEDELGLLEHHDGDDRINMVLDRNEWHRRKYASLRSLIDKKYAVDARKATGKQAGGGSTPSELLIRLISRDHKNDSPTLDSGFRLGVCRDLIGNTICADLLDYLHRDWLHVGKPRYFDPRLLDYMEILTRRREGIGREDRLVINLRGTPRPRPDAVTAILDLLEGRYQLSEIVLFHRAKLAAASMLERVIAEYRDTFPDEEAQDEALALLTVELLECSDVEMLTLFERRLHERRDTKNAKRIDGAVDLARRLRVRKLHRELHILYEDDIRGPERASAIAHRFSGDPDLPPEKARLDVRRAADDRLKAIRTLEGDFDLAPGDILMYCPPLGMNTKIAEVGIYVGGIVGSLAAIDKNNPRITGGHLSAQQQRFLRLWRISFAIDEDAYKRLDEAGMLGSLRDAIDRAVLWVPSEHGATAHGDVRAIAEDVTKLSSSPWFGRPVAEPALNRGKPDLVYPGGAPSVRSFIGPKSRTARNSRRS
jgi:HD superfamily phosphohydrolase